MNLIPTPSFNLITQQLRPPIVDLFTEALTIVPYFGFQCVSPGFSENVLPLFSDRPMLFLSASLSSMVWVFLTSPVLNRGFHSVEVEVSLLLPALPHC